ncbi:MAG TPA: aldo/keto reductase [Clostridiaceae bacterium]|nr:aldo/keto reductase [Clostridiaceae bacterium]
MKYRKFGKLNYEVSALGFGLMRLPTYGTDAPAGKEASDVVEDEAIRMIRYAIDHGINYIDTAYPYHNGQSEKILGKVLRDGYRNKIMLATKSPVWLLKEAKDFNRLLDEQLERLQTDYIDFYLFHALSKDRWEDIILKMNIIERAEAAKKAGKIKHLGFSFHDELDVFIKIIDSYDKWDFCQIQLNYMDIENQAGIEGLKYAASKGLAVVIMEPLLGGKLANPPEDIRAVFDRSNIKRSPACWGLQWLWNLPEVSVVLSGMSNMQQLQENIASANNSGIGALTQEELEIVNTVRQKYNERAAIPCTGCSYCMPCPNNVNIPENFRIYNKSTIYGDIASARGEYNNLIKEAEHAGQCAQCKLCEEKCPQKIPISGWMTKINSDLGK